MNLIDLSKKLRVRAELLQSKLEDSGLGHFPLDTELPEEIVDFLAEEKGGSIWGRLRSWFRREPEPEEVSSSLTAPGVPEPVAPDEAERALSDWKAQENAGAEEPAGPTFNLRDEMDAPDLEPSSQESETPPPIDVELQRELGLIGEAPETEPKTLQLAPDTGEFVQVPKADEPDAAHLSPDSSEELNESSAEPGPPAVAEAVPSYAPLFPPSQDPEPVGLDSELLLASLERLERLSENIPGVGSEPVTDLGFPLLEQEPDETALERELESLDEVEELPPLPASSTPVSKTSSGDLQAMVDEIIRGAPNWETRIEEDGQTRLSVMERIQSGVESMGLTPRDYAIFAVGICLTLGIIGYAAYHRLQNFGPGQDKHFYELGVSRQERSDLSSAKENFDKLITRFPESPFVPDSHRRLAIIARAQEDYFTASRTMKTVLETDLANIGSVTEEWEVSDQRQRTQDLFFLGEVAALQSDWPEAVDWFDQVMRENPTDSIRQHAQYGRAKSLYEATRWEETDAAGIRTLIAAHEQALSASPEAQASIPAMVRTAKMWERLAEIESGVRQENLKKAFEYQVKLEQKGKELVQQGIQPLTVRLDQARLLREMGDVQASIDLYEDIVSVPEEELEENPIPYKAWFGLARSLLERSDLAATDLRPASAQADLTRVLEISRKEDQEPFSEEELTEALYLRGHAQYRVGNLAAASSASEASQSFDKMDAAYRSALGRSDRFGKDGEDSLLAMVRRTNYLFQINQDYRDAAKSYRKILDQFPDNIYSFRIRHRLGVALFELGEYPEAEEQFQKVVDQFDQTRFTDDQAYREAYFGLGHCQFLQKDFGRAAASIKTLIQLLDYEESPEVLAAWRLLAEAYYSNGLYDEAVEELRNYLTRYPHQDPEGKIRLALGRTLIARFDYQEGRDELERVIDEYPGSEVSRWCRYLICESYIRESRANDGTQRDALLKEALEVASKIRVQYPAEDQPLKLLGEIHFELGDYDRASRDLEYYINASRGQSPLANVRLLLGEAYFRLKQYDRVIPQLSSVERTELSRDEAARSLYLLAESYRFQSRFPEAQTTYNQLLKDYPASAYSDLAPVRVEEVQWRISQGL